MYIYMYIYIYDISSLRFKFSAACTRVFKTHFEHSCFPPFAVLLVVYTLPSTDVLKTVYNKPSFKIAVS